MNGRSQRPARRAAAALLAVSAAALAILTAIPAVREANLSVSRTSEIRIPKRKLAPFARQFVSNLPILDVVAENDVLPGPEEAPAPAVLRVFDRAGENRLRVLLPDDLPQATVEAVREALTRLFARLEIAPDVIIERCHLEPPLEKLRRVRRLFTGGA